MERHSRAAGSTEDAPLEPVTDTPTKATSEALPPPDGDQEAADADADHTPEDQDQHTAPPLPTEHEDSNAPELLQLSAQSGSHESRYGQDYTFAYYGFDDEKRQWGLRIMNAIAESRSAQLPSIPGDAEVWGDTGNMAERELTELMNDPSKPNEVERRVYLFLQEVRKIDERPQEREDRIERIVTVIRNDIRFAWDIMRGQNLGEIARHHEQFSQFRRRGAIFVPSTSRRG